MELVTTNCWKISLVVGFFILRHLCFLLSKIGSAPLSRHPFVLAGVALAAVALAGVVPVVTRVDDAHLDETHAVAEVSVNRGIHK